MEGHARPDVRRTRHGSDRAARTGGSRASLTFRLQAVTARRPDPLLGAAARPRARAQCQARPRNRPGSASGRSPKRSSARTAGDAPTRRTKHSLTGASERIKLPHGHLHHRVRRPPQIAPRWHPCRAPKATAPTQIGTPERSKPPISRVPEPRIGPSPTAAYWVTRCMVSRTTACVGSRIDGVDEASASASGRAARETVRIRLHNRTFEERKVSL